MEPEASADIGGGGGELDGGQAARGVGAEADRRAGARRDVVAEAAAQGVRAAEAADGARRPPGRDAVALGGLLAGEGVEEGGGEDAGARRQGVRRDVAQEEGAGAGGEGEEAQEDRRLSGRRGGGVLVADGRSGRRQGAHGERRAGAEKEATAAEISA